MPAGESGLGFNSGLGLGFRAPAPQSPKTSSPKRDCVKSSPMGCLRAGSTWPWHSCRSRQGPRGGSRCPRHSPGFSSCRLAVFLELLLLCRVLKTSALYCFSTVLLDSYISTVLHHTTIYLSLYTYKQINKLYIYIYIYSYFYLFIYIYIYIYIYTYRHIYIYLTTEYFRFLQITLYYYRLVSIS